MEEEKRLTESQLFQCPSRCLREEEPHKQDLIEKKYAVADVVLPAGLIDTDRVDKLVEETCHATEPLEECDSFCASLEGEEFDEEGWVKEKVSPSGGKDASKTYCKSKRCTPHYRLGCI